MNRFQAMARIMAVITEDGALKPGSRRYKLARKMAARTIDRLGPDAALIQVVDRKPHLMQRLDILMRLEEGQISPLFLDF